jgi:hypothetical protein
MRNHANENITDFEIRAVRARRQETVQHTINAALGDEKKGVLKFVLSCSVSVILLLFFICYTKQLSDVEGMKAASSVHSTRFSYE